MAHFSSKPCSETQSNCCCGGKFTESCFLEISTIRTFGIEVLNSSDEKIFEIQFIEATDFTVSLPFAEPGTYRLFLQCSNNGNYFLADVIYWTPPNVLEKPECCYEEAAEYCLETLSMSIGSNPELIIGGARGSAAWMNGTFLPTLKFPITTIDATPEEVGVAFVYNYTEPNIPSGRVTGQCYAEIPSWFRTDDMLGGQRRMRDASIEIRIKMLHTDSAERNMFDIPYNLKCPIFLTIIKVDFFIFESSNCGSLNYFLDAAAIELKLPEQVFIGSGAFRFSYSILPCSIPPWVLQHNRLS